MKVEIAIAKKEVTGGYRPCWININGVSHCIVNWVGEPDGRMSPPYARGEAFSPDGFEVIDLLEILKVKK